MAIHVEITPADRVDEKYRKIAPDAKWFIICIGERNGTALREIATISSKFRQPPRHILFDSSPSYEEGQTAVYAGREIDPMVAGLF